MSDVLSRLNPPEGARHYEKRVGRGVGSGLGTTCGRGEKGQKARQPGGIHKLHFEGGQTTMFRRLPKRGFRVPFPTPKVALNVSELERFSAGTDVTEAVLRDARLVQGSDVVIKVLGEGKLTKQLTVSAHAFSKSAVEKIQKAGGKTVTLKLPEPKPVKRKEKK